MKSKAKKLKERFVSIKMMRNFINSRLKDLTEEQTAELYHLVREWTEDT
ncbi:MAG: hypothetical protein KGY80_09115 [Candidatus Thorarchaeota archaeon]|nr:hypothetical protein [Candidatus Thorarchaeota archaeon]